MFGDKYYFLGADIFLRFCMLFRVLLIEGRYGGGKSLLAVAVARWYAENYGYSIYSNIPVVGNIGELDEHQIFVLDEAWLEFSDHSSKSLKSWFAYLRKRDQIAILTSVLPIPGKWFQFKCRRLFNGLAFGLPFALYQYSLPGQSYKSRKPDTGIFWLINPAAVWKLYDHSAEPRSLRVWESDK